MEEKKTTIRYSDDVLEEFKTIILDKKQKAEKTIQDLQDLIKNPNSTDETFKRFDIQEDASEISAKETNLLLLEKQKKFVEDLNRALIRIENKTYGICQETGNLIEKKRLRVVPHTTKSVEEKIKEKNSTPKPVKEEKRIGKNGVTIISTMLINNN